MFNISKRILWVIQIISLFMIFPLLFFGFLEAEYRLNLFFYCAIVISILIIIYTIFWNRHTNKAVSIKIENKKQLSATLVNLLTFISIFPASSLLEPFFNSPDCGYFGLCFGEIEAFGILFPIWLISVPVVILLAKTRDKSSDSDFVLISNVFLFLIAGIAIVPITVFVLNILSFI